MNKMNVCEIERERIYNSLGQRVAKLLHLTKARFRSKERERVSWLGQLIPENGVIVDVGANFGYFAKEFARLHDDSCSVLAFEPLSYNFSILRTVVSALDNVKIHKNALSDVNGTDDLFVPIKKQGKIGPALAHFGPESERNYIKETVECLRLDDYVERTGIEKIDFIKIDVEGAELLVFKGANETLQRFKPVIYTEVSRDYTNRVGYAPETLFEFLRAFGYTPYLENSSPFQLSRVNEYTIPGNYLFRL